MQSQEQNFSQKYKTPCYKSTRQREPVSHGNAADGFSGILLLSEKHQFPISASCRETGNDVAGDIRRPCEYVYQRVCHHKSGISRKSTKRPAIINIQRKPVSHGACSGRIFRHSIVIRKAPISHLGELQRNWE